MRKRRGQIRKARVAMVLFAALLLLSGIAWGVYTWLHREDRETTLSLSYGELDLTAEHTAVVIRNEMVIRTNSNGSLVYFAEDGTMVKRNDPVLEIVNDAKSVEAESVVDVRVEAGSDVNAAEIALDYERMEYEIQQKRDLILVLIQKGDYYQAALEKVEFELLLNALRTMRANHQFLGPDSLSFGQRTIGDRLLPNQRLTLFAPVTGLLSYQTDGLEEVLKPNAAMTLDFDAVAQYPRTVESLRRDATRSGERLFRLVDSSLYYLLAKVTRDELARYESVEHVELTIDGERREAAVQEAAVQGEYGIVLFRLHEPFRGYADERVVRCTASITGYKGLLVPNESIIQRDGITGVYRVNADRILEFVPIWVLKYGNESAIIQHGRFYDPKLGPVDTVEIGQEIVRRPSMHSVGERVE